MKLVARSEPFHVTLDELMKLVPFTVKKKPFPPAAVDVGFMLVMVGTGLPVPALVTVTTTVLELFPGTGSAVVLAIEAVLDSEPATFGVTTMVIVALLPLWMLTKLQVTVLVPEQDPMEAPPEAFWTLALT